MRPSSSRPSRTATRRRSPPSDLTAHAVHLLAQGTEPTGLVGLLRSYALDNRTRYHERWLGDLWMRTGEDATAQSFIARGWDECLEVLNRLAAALRDPSPETDPCLTTGDGWIAEEALATALQCFLLFPEAPLTALRRAACTRGDSDSIACLTGAFMRRPPRRLRLARRLAGADRTPGRAAGVRRALGRLSPGRLGPGARAPAAPAIRPTRGGRGAGSPPRGRCPERPEAGWRRGRSRSPG